MESQFIGFGSRCNTCVALVSVQDKEAFGEWEGANGSVEAVDSECVVHPTIAAEFNYNTRDLLKVLD